MSVRQTHSKSKFLWRWLPPVSKSSQEHFWKLCFLAIWSLRLPYAVCKLKWNHWSIGFSGHTATSFCDLILGSKRHKVFSKTMSISDLSLLACAEMFTKELRTEATRRQNCACWTHFFTLNIPFGMRDIGFIQLYYNLSIFIRLT